MILSSIFLQILLHPRCIHGKSIILASYEDIHFIGSVMHPHCIHSFFSPFLVSSCLFVFICFSFPHSHFCQEGVIDCLPLFKRSQHYQKHLLVPQTKLLCSTISSLSLCGFFIFSFWMEALAVLFLLLSFLCIHYLINLG